MDNLYYIFKSTGSLNSNDSFQLFLDNDGNIINKNDVEYGVFNQVINIKIQKLLFVKIKKIGLGDIVDFITKKTGLKKIIMYVTNGNCGCEERRVKFNKIKIPYLLTIKTRPLYDVDEKYVKKNKNLIFKKLEEKTQPKVEKKSIQTKQSETKNISINQKPVTHNQIKKSCGCGKK